MGRYANQTDIVLDIETVVIPPTQEEIDEAAASYEPPGNYKNEETIAKHRAEFIDTLPLKLSEDRAFSFEGKRMVSCALGYIDGNNVSGIISIAGDDATIIARGIVSYLDQFGDYRLIGWNCGRFDIPEIVKSMFLANVSPKRKPSKWDMIDLNERPFRGLKMKNVAKGLGLELMDVDGSDVARLHANGEWDKIKEYNEYDVYLTGMIYIAASKLFSF